ncbi:hypothetical protein [Streptomyces murinus]|uniref:hypothetical protein n=1 Tax=Streptomyces murinus TaxID=33900 RepID=UPI00382758A9
MDHRRPLAHVHPAGSDPHQGPHARPPRGPHLLTPPRDRPDQTGGRDKPITVTLLAPDQPDVLPSGPVLNPTVVHHPFAARRELEALLGTWLDTLDIDRLCALSTLSEERMAGHFSTRLLETLRWEAALAVASGDTGSKSPVKQVRFGTSTWDNGVFYSEMGAEFVHADGTVSELDSGDQVAARLADLSSVDHPDDSDTLTVDLVTCLVTR